MSRLLRPASCPLPGLSSQSDTSYPVFAKDPDRQYQGWSRWLATRALAGRLLGVSALSALSVAVMPVAAVSGVSATMLLGSALITQPAQAAVAVDFSQLVEQVAPAVVRVTVERKLSREEELQQQLPDILRRFFGDQVQIPNQAARRPNTEAYGSAFFISSDGYLLTNNHVVADARRISITLNDRREIDAELVGSDPRTDVAVLRVKGSGFPALRLGNADTLKVGEPVLAIGSPFGFDYSASAGIVSAKSRSMSRETAVPFIQSDVALNPGNSGGPLFNQRGEVVGVNSRIFSGTGGYMGLSFSIPIDVAMQVADQLKRDGRVTRAYLGVFPQDLDRDLAELYKLPRPEGTLVNQVTPGSAAAEAGIRVGDLILSFNNTPITRADDLINLINRSRPDQRVAIGLLRDGKRLSVNATLKKAEDDDEASSGSSSNSQASQNRTRFGIAVRELSSAEQARGRKGIVVTDVSYDGLAARAGLQGGDLIVRLNNRDISDLRSFSTALESLPRRGVVGMTVVRQGQPFVVGLRLD